MVANTRLEHSPGEPALNVYRNGGRFKPHCDLQSLTILVALSDPAQDFEGGGTAFWSIEDRGFYRQTTQECEIQSDPTIALRCPVGTALMFTGSVTHAGQPVTSGERTVLVASFSPACAAASAPGSSPSKTRRGRDADPFRVARRQRERVTESKEFIRRAMEMRQRAASGGGKKGKKVIS